MNIIELQIRISKKMKKQHLERENKNNHKQKIKRENFEIFFLLFNI